MGPRALKLAQRVVERKAGSSASQPAYRARCGKALSGGPIRPGRSPRRRSGPSVTQSLMSASVRPWPTRKLRSSSSVSSRVNAADQLGAGALRLGPLAGGPTTPWFTAGPTQRSKASISSRRWSG